MLEARGLQGLRETRVRRRKEHCVKNEDGRNRNSTSELGVKGTDFLTGLWRKWRYSGENGSPYLGSDGKRSIVQKLLEGGRKTKLSRE